ncbi:MAG: hypothetical protein AAB599_00280 [Patescibacteria group bacterium]
MPTVLNASEARARFAEITNRVQYLGEEFIVEKQGKPVALITNPVKKVKNKRKSTNPGLEFLGRVANYHAKGGPKDLAKNHDKYLWENYRS